MNKREIEIYKMLTRVEDFGSRNVSMFPKSSAAAEILKTLGSGVEKLSEASATHASAEAAIRQAHDARQPLEATPGISSAGRAWFREHRTIGRFDSQTRLRSTR